MKKGNKEEKDSEKNINVRRLPVTPFPYCKICHSKNLCWYKAREKYKTCHSLEHGGMQNKENQQGQQVQVAKYNIYILVLIMVQYLFWVIYIMTDKLWFIINIIDIIMFVLNYVCQNIF